MNLVDHSANRLRTTFDGTGDRCRMQRPFDHGTEAWLMAGEWLVRKELAGVATQRGTNGGLLCPATPGFCASAAAARPWAYRNSGLGRATRLSDLRAPARRGVRGLTVVSPD